jgi:hypothetical protein
LWVGQQAVPLGGSAALCWVLGWDWWHQQAHLIAIVYGGAMMVVAAIVVILAVRLFALGPLLLVDTTDAAVRERAARLARRAAICSLVVATYFFLVMRYVPIPGRWNDLIYVGVVLIPVGLGALLVLLVACVLRRPPWVARSTQT